jgi:N-acetylmuramoyl-L-alanine amidase
MKQAPQLQTTSQPATALPDGASTELTLGSLLPDSAPGQEQDALRGVLPQITGIRHWESEDSSTVVIDLQDQVQYEVHRLTSPERIYFDLHDTALAQSLNGKTIEVGDQLLARIRVAQPFPGVSRVVLETTGVSNFSVGLEPNPYRLSIEISRISTHQKSKADMLQSGTAPEENAHSAPAPMSKEDRALRARVPRMKVVLDAGHGGWDLGAVGQRGLVEKDLVLDVVQRLGTLLQTRLGTDVVYTRDDDMYVPLEHRAEMANEAQADLFVSIHGNNSDYPSARGVETYYTSVSAPANSLDIEKRENSTAKAPVVAPVLTAVTLKERTAESRRLAASVERALYGALSSKNPGLRDRGVKDAGFVVLTNTSMPAILAEISFVSSPKDEQKLQSSAYRQGIAEALYKGIMRYAAGGVRLKLASVRGGSR